MHILSLRCKRPADTLQTFCRHDTDALQKHRNGFAEQGNASWHQYNPFKPAVYSV